MINTALLKAIIVQGVAQSRSDTDISAICRKFTDEELSESEIQSLIAKSREKFRHQSFRTVPVNVKGVYLEPVQGYEHEVSVAFDKGAFLGDGRGTTKVLDMHSYSDAGHKLNVQAALEWSVFDDDGAKLYCPFANADFSFESMSIAI